MENNQRNDRESGKFRELQGVSNIIFKTILFLIPFTSVLYILSAYQWFVFSDFWEQYTGLLFALILAGVYIGVPITADASKTKVPWYDWVLAIAGFGAGMYISVFYPTIVMLFDYVTVDRLVLAGMGILLIFEALRRCSAGHWFWLERHF